MDKESIKIRLIEKILPHVESLARLTKVPVLGELLEMVLFSEKDDMVYLPKNEVVEVGEFIEPPESMALPSRVVEHFIREANFHWKMDFCICRKSNQCEDYPGELGCLFLGEAAKEIPSEYGEPITEEEALEHLEKCRDAGLVHLIGRHKLDTLWLNVGPGRKLLTICNCCPCCCLHRMLPELRTEQGSRIKKMPGVKVEVTDDCMGCGACTEEICFVDAISIGGDGKAEIGEECRGCGRCVNFCPEDAIELTVEDSEFLEKSIERIEDKVNVS